LDLLVRVCFAVDCAFAVDRSSARVRDSSPMRGMWEEGWRNRLGSVRVQERSHEANKFLAGFAGAFRLIWL
jgi:hypothetical protein